MSTAQTARLDLSKVLSSRAKSIDASGIRKVFDLAAHLKNPINLSIGQPDFHVPEVIKDAAIRAIHENRNGYTQTQGCMELLNAIWARLGSEVGWAKDSDGLSAIVTSGTSGGLLLAMMCLLDADDEAIVPDPYFVMYPQLGALTGGRMVLCDTYPDFRMTAERIEPLITPRTKTVLVNSPGNPTGVVLNSRELSDIVDLCRARNIVLISDEIYDEFTFRESREGGRFPTPARFTKDCLLVRGFGKTYGCTGWRLGYVAGPHDLVQSIAKLQQYTYVCAPSMAQFAAAHCFEVDMQPWVDRYEERRNTVLKAFEGIAHVATPGGAFYAFVEVPKSLGLTASQFVERAIERSVLVIPGKVFSTRDTHFRLSFAAKEETLAKGLEILRELMMGR
ncbi:MAG: aminotransferase class I/II-fold pyridoxal phosphate-dependent enzyme [Planctomycetaceae bacterium]|nr:aminotransferase class I/II-fold pyridoxal phosphate-dependent enzyme [Planctomycetaceae bacterium]